MPEANHTARNESCKTPASENTNLVGLKFGRWLVLDSAGSNNDGKRLWHCRCECGTERDVIGKNLRRGRSRSCGVCDRNPDCRRRGGKKPTALGESRTRLYKIWGNIHSRCYQPETASYPYYGGRGIVMCDEWKDDYVAFRNWALSHGYAADLTTERRNPNGPYSPDNCTWATIADQNRNRTNTVYLTAFGETKQLTLWAADPRCKVRLPCLRVRINKGWEAEVAIATPNIRQATR